MLGLHGYTFESSRVANHCIATELDDCAAHCDFSIQGRRNPHGTVLADHCSLSHFTSFKADDERYDGAYREVHGFDGIACLKKDGLLWKVYGIAFRHRSCSRRQAGVQELSVAGAQCYWPAIPPCSTAEIPTRSGS